MKMVPTIASQFSRFGLRVLLVLAILSLSLSVANAKRFTGSGTFVKVLPAIDFAGNPTFDQRFDANGKLSVNTTNGKTVLKLTGTVINNSSRRHRSINSIGCQISFFIKEILGVTVNVNNTKTTLSVSKRGKAKLTCLGIASRI